MPDFAVTTAFRATDKLSPVFKRMGASAKTFERQSVGVFGRISNAASRTRTAIMSALPYVGIATLGIYAKKAIDLASDLTEVQNVVDTTFKKSSKVINNWSQTALEAYGLSELQAKKYTGTLGAMAKGVGVSTNEIVGMSTGLTGLAGDYASFYNLPIEEAFNKIRAGISGETEPLKQIGKDMSVAGLEAFRMAQGIEKSVKQMSIAEKYQLRYSYLMSQSKDQIGDFSKTLDESYANQKRVLGVQFDQFLANVAKNILPSLVDVFKSLNATIKNIPVETFAKALGLVAKILPYIIGGFIAYKAALMGAAIWQGIVSAVGWIKYLSMMAPIILASVKAQGFWITMLKGTAAWETILAVKTKILVAAQWLLNAALTANPIGLIIVGIAALIALVTVAIYKWNEWGAALMLLLGPLGMVISFIKTLYDQWQAVKNAFTAGGIIEGIKMIGKVMIASLIYPVEQLLQLISKIPGVGSLAGSAAESLKNFREGLTAPNKAEVEARTGSTTVNINNRNVETQAEVTPRQGAQINYAAMGAQ